MMFKHNKRPFSGDEIHEFAYKHSRKLDCQSQLDFFVETSLCTSISEKTTASDENSEKILDHFQGEGRSADDSITEFSVLAEKDIESKGSAIIPNDHFVKASSIKSSLALVTRSNDESAISSDHGESPSGDEESYQFACDRKADFHRQLTSPVEILPFRDVLENSVTLDGEGQVFKQYRGENKPLYGNINELSSSAFDNLTGNAPVGISSLSRVTCTTGEGGLRSELPIRLSLSPRFSENDYRTGAAIQAEDIHVYFLDSLPRKQVAVGSDHQADIPKWNPQESSSVKVGSSDSTCPLTDEANSEKFLGECVVPMANAAAEEDAGIGNRTECSCPDEGSIRCMRQHVMEARERLKKALGKDRFVRIGFCNMGEDVAMKWSEDEEQVFHEVVLTNPASLNKNFWMRLQEVFPCRCNKDLVSYYFNVFMLRIRSEQNRVDTSDVDSDNDEWHQSYDGEGFEEGSVVESPTDCEDAYSSDDDCHDDDFGEVDEEDRDGDDDRAIAGEYNDEVLFYDSSERCIGNRQVAVVNHNHFGENLLDGMGLCDVRNGLSTAVEGSQSKAVSNGCPSSIEATAEDPSVEKLEVGYRKDIMDSETDPLYIVSPGNSKTWDLSYFLGPEKGFDFLPTCHVIEAVFGKGAWDNETRDGQRIG